MNTKINALNKKLDQLSVDSGAIQTELQNAWNEVFDDMPQLREKFVELDNSQEYGLDEYGNIISWVRFITSPFQDSLTYLGNWFSEHGVYLDAENDALTQSHGDDNLIIQDDTRRDNGVWQSRKLIISESEYRDDGETDTTKRNALIEAHMKKTEYFPGVFRVDSHGNVFSVKTTV